ncbi:uncharacterized protein [Primulina huaijiensis]|uniref:uncharacterized protein n=1 Tax=Primulina huaijiensis TaxID=1492673 RepID=UPI003CC6F770
MFFGKYFPADVNGLLTREFLSLWQWDLSVAEFIHKFDRGCHFVPMIARDATKKLRHFAEQALRDIDFEMQRKRHQIQSSSQQQRPPQEPGAHEPEEGYPCRQCNRFHFGKCMWETYKCFICGQEGHKAVDCPRNKGSTLSRAYVMHAEAEPDSTLITGRIYIAGVATHALLDSGATNSFISEYCIKRQGTIPVAMDSGFRVSIPSGNQMFTSQVVKRLELRLQKYGVQADLIVLPLPEFDIILGIDWLSSHGAVIDFRQRSVSVRPSSGKLFVFEAARHQQLPHVISRLCARKLMRRGCQAFLASILSVSEQVK